MTTFFNCYEDSTIDLDLILDIEDCEESEDEDLEDMFDDEEPDFDFVLVEND